MVVTPRHLFTTPVVLTSGIGFDDFGELTFSGSVPVSGTGYLKTTQRYAVTNAGIATFHQLEVFTDPREMTPQVGDQLVARSVTYRVTQVRPVIDRDGFRAVDISQLQEVDA